MTQQKEYTWDDLVAAIGQDFSGGETRTGEVLERGFIRRFCEPVEMDCPLHYDDEVAKQHGYQGMVAPVSMIHQTLVGGGSWMPGEPTRWTNADRNDNPILRFIKGKNVGRAGLPMPPTTAGMATDIEIEYFAPVYVGDALTTKGRKLVSVNVRETKVGFGAFITIENEIHNQRGEVVAKCRNGFYYYNPTQKQ